MYGYRGNIKQKSSGIQSINSKNFTIMATDWKDILASMASGVPDGPEEGNNATEEGTVEEGPRQKGKLRVVLDKKGRKGKMATIIEGFEISDEEVAETAKRLKQRLATGGSSRGGEILLQGDFKERATEELKRMGYRL